MRIIITHGGDNFSRFQGDLERVIPQSTHKIDSLHQTPPHSLPLDIDESTIVGGADAVDAIFEVLQLKMISGCSSP